MLVFKIKMNDLSHSSLWFTALSIFCLCADPIDILSGFFLVFVGAIDNFLKIELFWYAILPSYFMYAKKDFLYWLQ